jgi:hypothetical protein
MESLTPDDVDAPDMLLREYSMTFTRFAFVDSGGETTNEAEGRASSGGPSWEKNNSGSAQ